MFKFHLLTTWRHLIRDRQFSLLNIIGLSTGLAASLLIYLWVADEYSVDKFNANDSRLYQVLKTTPNADGTVWTQESTQGLMARSMARELPEVEYAVSFRPDNAGIVSVGDKHLKATPAFADKDFFRVFTYRILEGNKAEPLADPKGVLVSDRLAERLFHTTTGLIGKTIGFNGGEEGEGEFTGLYKITGVFVSPPANATNKFDLLFTYALYWTKETDNLADWGSNGESTYLLLKPGTDIDRFNKKIKFYTQDKIRSLYKGDQQKYLLKWEGELFAQRFSDRYLHNQFVNGHPSGGRIAYVRLFSLIAVFILVIACINFMNLSTAKATRRAREVGVKKVAGASRGSLILQYLGESMLLSFASLVIALLLAIVLLPALDQLTGKDMALRPDFGLVSAALAIAFVTGLLAGSYPAVVLSGFRPALVLKSNPGITLGAGGVRKALVVFQFAVSVILIITVLVVYRQMRLIQTTDLGYNRANVIRFTNDGSLRKDLSPFLAEIRRLPGVVSVSDGNGDFFGQASHGGSGINWEGKDPNLGLEYYGNDVDDDFFQTLGLQMVEGRPFIRGFADSSSVIFNASAIAAMGLKDPVGKLVSLWGKQKTIVGVVRDYHFQSMYKKVGPAFLTWHENNEYTFVSIKPGSERAVIDGIKTLYGKWNSGLEFNYAFLDDAYNALYASEERVAVLSRYFAGMAILISSLGLFGLAAFNAQRRRKEVGIRKVLGASVGGVAVMLSGELLRLIAIAILIAFPVAWWAAHAWLQSFAYRVTLGPGIFLLAGGSVMAITLLTVSWQTVRAAVTNPVESLRSE
jgi:putative ABC transport system permease protein